MVEHLDQPVELVEGRDGGPADDVQRAAGPLGIALARRQRRPGLHHHDTDGVGHHVVQLARDGQPLGPDGGGRGRVELGGPSVGAGLRPPAPDVADPHHLARRRPRHRW